MLEEVGYTPEGLKKNSDKLSIIDPACGAGTFLYSAVDRIIESFNKENTEEESKFIKELVKKNVFGLDIEEFPLYLAEMSILMRLLPLIINDDYENPINEKIKVFKTKDSISEFLDAKIGAVNPEIDFPTLFSQTHLSYDSFMRDDKNLQEMIESMQGHNGERMRFDFVVGNPPYIGYNESCKQNIPFTLKIKDKEDNSITMGDVYGVNLNTVPNHRKPYSPKPNLYAFFVALSLSLLKKGGKMCYIIPQTMLTSGDLDVLRYHLAKNTTIEKLLTFEGNLFTGRGLEQKRPIATSSLIFIVKKEILQENHKVEIINYKPYFTKKGESFKVYFKGKHRRKAKHILQSELLENVENWNFIKIDKKSLIFNKKYAQNTLSIEDYRKKVLKNYDEVQFDKGLVFDKNNINKETYDWALIKGNKKYYHLELLKDFISNKFIRFPQGTQGLQIFENQYKIIWRSMNFDKFYFSDKKVMINATWIIISSQNKSEILFLLSLLNSPISYTILKSYLKLPNEKDFLVGIKSIKQYIRVPKITTENQLIKDKIIALTKKMLDLENVTLKDFVDFSNLMVQKFDNIEIRKNNLVLISNNKEYSCKIEKGQENFVKKVISEKYFDNGLVFNKESVTLQELKNLEAIDFEAQAELKKQIDDLVYGLYFESL
jgi:hypothetical protein